MNHLLKGVVRDCMKPVKHVVSAIQRIDEVATLFSEHHVNSAPVVDEAGRCIGIITSTDLVRFQSHVNDVNSRIDHGLSFDVTQCKEGEPVELVPHPFDEVQRQMSTGIQTIDAGLELAEAAKIMTEQHIHHLVVLDQSERPVGILSSLDLLAKLKEI